MSAVLMLALLALALLGLTLHARTSPAQAHAHAQAHAPAPWSCSAIRRAVQSMTREQIAAYARTMSASDIAAAKRCLKTQPSGADPAPSGRRP